MSNSICAFCLEQCENGICTACGKSISEYTPAPHHLKPGTMLSEKYIVGAVLGEGGFGITYLCRDINLNINVAVKEYFPSGVVNRNAANSCDVFAPQGELRSVFEKGKNSFLEEARTLARFSNEPGIVFVRDFFSENNTVYIVMEYLNGITLKEHIEQNGKMNFEQSMNLLFPIMNTLSNIHAEGLIHRDISPSNIIILGDENYFTVFFFLTYKRTENGK